VALVTIALVLAAALGVALGGRASALARVPLAGWGLLAAAACCQVAGSLLARAQDSSGLYEVGSVAAVLLLVAFLARNSALPGIPLVALGLLLNLVAVAANGAMPVSAWAAQRTGIDLSRIAAGLDARHQVADASTTLRPLTDVVPVPVPGFREVLSPGDLLVAAGLALLLVTALLWGQPLRARRPGSAGMGTPEDSVRDTTRASASTTRGSYS
jgi:hypothetical protein